jgi:ribosomal protein S12 methylthiotransferase
MVRDRRRLRTIHLIALGCPKNRVDTEVLAGIAAERGLEIVGDPARADAIVVATCGFVESAREESIQALLETARYKQRGRCRLLVAASCLAQRHGEELARELPEVDAFLGTGDLNRLGDVLDGTAPRVAVGRAAGFVQGPGTPRFLEPGAFTAYVKIADGCSRKCAFCAIPQIKGRARSRPPGEIADEVRDLARRGVVEIDLVSQDTSAFGRDLRSRTDLVRLLRELDRIDGIEWIRLLYLYPDSVDDELLRTIAASRRVVPYLDVPIQHASAHMLRRMKRGHGPATLRRLVERARRILPRVFLRSAVLVGHPGETAADFAELLGFIEQARFDHLGAFRYSDEQGTPAHETGPAVRPRDSYNRLRRVLAVQRPISRAANRALKGRTVRVLVEGPADDRGYVLQGRHAGQAPEVDGTTYLVSCDASPGEFVDARVVRASDYDLVAEPL